MKTLEADAVALEKKEFELPAKPDKLFGIRHLQVFLIFLGLVMAYGIRVSMSVGIVAMTDPTSTSANVTTFSWPRQTQDIILSSFFWGYIVSQIPAGVVAERFGGKFPLVISLAANGIICFIIPFAAKCGGWGALCACRVLQGLFQGLFYPSCHALLGKWAPISERGRLSTYVYAGAQFGTVVFLPLVGQLCGSSWGWPSTFYTMGIGSIVWMIVYFIFGADSPRSSKFISTEEKDYIEGSLGQAGEKTHIPTPWRAILTSLPFWSLLVCQCGHNWGFWMLLTEMPSYMKLVLGVDIKNNGLLTALPYFVMWMLSFVFSYTSDYAINKKIVSITVARKVSNTIGFWGPALALIGLSYAPSDITVAVTLLTVTVGINAGHYVGYQVNHIDLAPNFAGVLLGITNAAANTLSIVAPLSVGLMLSKEHEKEAEAWRPIFFLSSAIYFLFNLFWLLFGTSEQQPWNDPNYLKKSDIETSAPRQIQENKKY